MSGWQSRFFKMLILSLLGGLTWACARSPEAAGTMLLERMHELARAPALTFELIQESLEVAFVKDEPASHEMVTFFTGTPRPGSRFDGLLKLVDCRVATPRNAALEEPFVVVELQDRSGEQAANAARRAAPLLVKDVVARLGQPDSFQPAFPEDPETSASYIYKTASRSLWVSLGRQNPDAVRSMSIHPLEDVR
jgi:hypothetical protein